MDELVNIRRIQHQKYLRENWLPIFFQKYRKLFDKKNRAAIIIYRFFKKYFFHQVLNLTIEELNGIPGLFRLRIKLTEQNLSNPNLITKKIDQKLMTNNKTKPSLEEKIISEIMEKSLGEYLFENAIEDENDILTSITFEESISFWVCIDLRIYGPNPNLEIYMLDTPYYLTKFQMEKIKNTWFKINGNSSDSIKYLQNFEFNKALSKDL
ncbi:Hypothetical protein KVN_LOCUS159 [uncultured virus]|nr:Hypothetical protein KVN_LOCUS159 [uncultured virus]